MSEVTQIRTILRWRWIILFFSIVFVAVIEWLEHQALTLLLAREFFVYGLAMPICIWLLLTLLARHMARQVALADELEQYRQIGQRLAYYPDRNELAQFVTRIPSTLMPVDQVMLFQYDHLKAKMEFLDEWNADGRVRTPACYVLPAADLQYLGQISKSSGLHQACTCPLIAVEAGAPNAQHFCLPLICDNMLVGLLRLRCSPGQVFPDRQVQFLETIASHIALALALSIAFPQQVTAVQRTERHRLAYELHDSLAQQIGYLHLGLDRLAEDERLENVAGLRTELDRLREVAGESYMQVRNKINLLQNQPAIDLVRTIENYIRSIEPRVPYQIEFRTSGSAIPLGPLTSRHIFGMIREGLNNVQKHAQAQRVNIAMLWQDAGLDITLTDDGAGFDLTSVPTDGHYGLSLLRERAQELRGEIRIISAPGAGTSVQFKIPLSTLTR